MKRFSFVVVFVSFALAASSASAQNTDRCRISFSGGYTKPAAVALEYITTACNYTVVYEDNVVPNQLLNLDGTHFETVTEAVARIVSNIDFQAMVDPVNRTITISRREPPSSLSVPVPTSPKIVTTIGPQPQAVPANMSYIAQIASRYPNAYQPNGTINSYNEAAAMAQEASYYNPNGFFSASYSYGVYAPYMAAGCVTGPAGYIKFKYVGPSKERVLWDVYVNGEIQGSLDQGDSAWNSVWTCAGHAQVKAVKRGVGSDERSYSIRPGVLTEITIGDFLFSTQSKP